MKYKWWITGILIGLLSNSIFQYSTLYDSKLHIIICDVGQGDAILVKTPKNKFLLFDAGPDVQVLWCLAKHMPYWQRTLHLVVLSHPHADHFFGLYFIGKIYRIMTFATEAISNKSSSYKEIMKLLESKHIPKQYVYADDSMSVDEVSLHILSPTHEMIESKSVQGVIGESMENISVLTRLSYGSFAMLLTGDIPVESLKQIDIDDIDVLQSPHHGSKTGMDKQLLDKINPQLVVISVGANNRYGHPHKNILQLYIDKNIPVLRTDKSGDIEIVSDGNSWGVRGENKF